MKLSSLFSSFLFTSASIGTYEHVITDLPGFIDAVQNASEDPLNPSTILVSPEATLDFDQATNLTQLGLIVSGKFFEAKCKDYDQTNKCTLERNNTYGSFFFFYGPTDISFEGFRFVGARNWYGGAFSVRTAGGITRVASANFTDCDFVGNSGGRAGGAFYIRTIRYGGQPSLYFNRCLFDSNTATRYYQKGGAIYATTGTNGRVTMKIVIKESTFSNNGSINGTVINDIMVETENESNPGTFILDCTETTTSGNDTVIFPYGQVCSDSTNEPSLNDP